MQNVPQIVRERLKAAPPAVNHPDADVLTAFAERALPDRERTLVLDHLARCSACRNIMVFARPEADAAEPAALPAGGGWLRWPALRWGFAAVGIALIASFGVLKYQRSAQIQSSQAIAVAKPSRQESVAAQVQPAPVLAADEQAREPKRALRDAPPAADAQSAAPATLAEPKLLSHAAPPHVQPPHTQGAVAGVVGGPVAHGFGPHMPRQMQQQHDTTNQLQVLPPSAKQQGAEVSANLGAPASQTVNVQAATNQVATSQEETQAQDQLAALPSQPAELFDTTARVRKAKPAAPQPPPTLPNSALLPRWAINPAGGLQRSFDQGNTWQDVDVSANAVPPAGTRFLALAKDSRAKEKEADKKVLKAPASVAVFRALAVNGPDVWAGGSQGMLYHSFDAGNHWAQIVPSAIGATLTGDIVGLLFSDARNGRITTSTGEIWTTADQGQTWQKQ